ncbi:MAG: TetR/AcrR family transcriptional regulator [Thermodesulfobacteriota bacterium]
MGVAERRMREKHMRRLDIMDAAKKVFSIKGFTGATMEEIAEKAELSPATLYNYFKSKYDLYASLNLRMLTRLAEILDSLASRADLEPLEKIRRLSQAMYELYEFDPLILRNVIHLQASELMKGLAPETASEINALAAKSLRTLAAIFSEAIDHEIIEVHNPIALGDIIWGLFTGLVLWEESKRLFDPKKEFLKPTLDLAVALLARGLRRREAGQDGEKTVKAAS